MTNLLTKTSVKITSKEVLVQQKDNLDDPGKQVQEENKGKEAARSHPTEAMEAGSEGDLVADSSSQEDIKRAKRHLNKGQGTEVSDLFPTVLPPNCIPGSKLVKQVQQTVESSIFNMETNMTVDGKYDLHSCLASQGISSVSLR